MQKIETNNKVSSIEELDNSKILIEKDETSNHTLSYAIMASFKVGTFGFAVVLTLIIVTKLLAFSIGAKDTFILNINDVVIASWGFVILSFSRFISFQKK